MAFQDLTLFSGGGSGRTPVDVDQEPSAGTLNGVGDESGKTPRLPRWTRQEILVLIQGKRVAENRVRRGRTAGLAYGSGQPEPKWASVSSYCRRHGVNRGPIQCRKRWSNLTGDFKKIKEWETGVVKEEEIGAESYWVMRNDLRRERKLPGFFDKEVYDILDGVIPVPVPVLEDAAAGSGLALSLTAGPDGEGEVNEREKKEVIVEEGEDEAVFDSGRSAAAEDGLFSDFEQSGGGQSPTDKETLFEKAAATGPPGIPAPTPISEKQYHPFTGGVTGHQGTTSEQQQAAVNPEIGSTSNNEKKKRKRLATETEQPREEERERETNNNNDNLLQDQLLEVLERNSRILGSHLENQNTNLKLDREERKDYANSLVSALNKLADALGKIADKL